MQPHVEATSDNNPGSKAATVVYHMYHVDATTVHALVVKMAKVEAGKP